MIRRRIALGGAAALAASISLVPAHAATSLTGAGSTFDQPFFAKAFEVYQSQHGVTVNYQPIGSGAGIQQFTAKTVDFGASDVPMDPTTELKAAVKAGGPVVQVPVALGGVSMAYNLPGIKSGLHLTGSVVADIYAGLITKWDAPAIKKLNPKVKLPSTAIVVVHRSDASGTSYAFTDYLSKVSDTWRGKVGVGKLPNWPVGVGGKGNTGVAAVVQQTPGAIGYVELAYVLQNKMTQALVQNKAHRWLYPTLKTVAADAAQFPNANAKNFSITNGKGKTSYPIATYSWALIFKHPPDNAKAGAIRSLMGWIVTKGQVYAKRLDYVPLPKKIQKIAFSELKQVK